MLLFSVNQYSEDVAGRLQTKLNSIVDAQNTQAFDEQLEAFIAQNSFIEEIVFVDSTLESTNVEIKKSSMNNSYLADKEYTEKQFANFITNLSVAIQAEKSGLRKSAIYLSGLYEITEAVPVLVNQLKKEENADVKILTILVLFRLEDPKGMEAIENLYKHDENARVKNMSKAILDEFKNKLAVTEVSKR